MKPNPRISGFTLIEMLTSMAVVVILTSIVLGIAGYVSRSANGKRAQSEIAALSLAISQYKAENGNIPQDYIAGKKGVTDQLSPKVNYIPTDTTYTKAGEFLYKELTGDKTGAASTPDGIPDADTPVYFKEFDPRIVKYDRDKKTDKITKAYYFVDPWGYPYGYSTAALYEEQAFQKDLRAGKSPTRKLNDNNPGFNMEGFDMWSTAGSKRSTAPATAKEKELEWSKWIKNW